MASIANILKAAKKGEAVGLVIWSRDRESEGVRHPGKMVSETNRFVSCTRYEVVAVDAKSQKVTFSVGKMKSRMVTLGKAEIGKLSTTKPGNLPETA